MKDFAAFICLILGLFLAPTCLYMFTGWVNHQPAPLTAAAASGIAQTATPEPLTQADKTPARRTAYTDDIESFVTYDVPPRQRAAALLGAQRALSWLERHGEIDIPKPAAGDSP